MTKLKFLKSSNPEVIAHYSIPFAIIAASFAAIFIRFSNAHPLSIAFYRMLFSSLILLGFIPNHTKEIRSLKKQDWLILISTGLFLAIHFAAWISSLEFTTVASSVILVSSHPLVVSWIGGWYLKEKSPTKFYFGVMIALTGVSLMVISDYQVSEWALAGDILAIVGMLGMAGYILRGRKIRPTMSLVPYAFLVYLFSTIFLGLFSLGFSNSFQIYPTREYILFLSLAVIPTMFGHTVYNWALKYVKARLVSISLFGEPIGSSILAFFILNEIPPRLSILGGIITLFGVYYCIRKKD